MREIFKKIEGKIWDWFGWEPRDSKDYEIIDKEPVCFRSFLELWSDCSSEPIRYSLADLLSNKSWAKAVWGERKDCTCGPQGRISLATIHNMKCEEVKFAGWESQSKQTFTKLQQEGEEAAIDYIKSTMI